MPPFRPDLQQILRPPRELRMMTLGSNAAIRAGLADLLLQPLVAIPHALVFVRIGRTQSAHFRGDESTFCRSMPLTVKCVSLGSIVTSMPQAAGTRWDANSLA